METNETGKDSTEVQMEIIREVQVDPEVIVNLNDEMVEIDLGQILDISSRGCEHQTELPVIVQNTITMR